MVVGESLLPSSVRVGRVMDIDSRAEDAETLEGTGSVLPGSNVPTYRLKGLSGSASGDRSWIAAGPLGSNHSFRVQDYGFLSFKRASSRC